MICAIILSNGGSNMKFIENSNEGVHCYNRFSADYSDDIVAEL